MEEQPAGASAAVRREAYSASQTLIDGIAVPLGAHLCGLYASDLGQVRQAVAFLVDGLGPGSVCFFVGPAAINKRVLERLSESRPAVRNDIETGRLVFSEYASSPQAQWDYWETQLGAAQRAGARSMRVVGDLVGLGQQISKEDLLAYEVGYEERIARRFPVVTLCQYDMRTFSRSSILNALKGHRDTFSYPADRLLA